MSEPSIRHAALKLSIITANLNNRAGLERTLESVRKQQASASFEHVVVDGGSVDDSQDVIRRHAERLACWVSEPDRGIYHAMNKGVARARGEHLLFLNAGDCLADEHVLRTALADMPDADIVYGAIRIVHDGKAGRVVTQPPPERLCPSFWLKNTIQHSATFIRRALLLRHPYDEEYRIVADRKFFFEAFLEGHSFARIPHLVTHFDMGGISNDPAYAALRREERERLFTRHMSPALLKRLREEIAWRDREAHDIFGARDAAARSSPALRALLRRWIDLFYLLHRHVLTRAGLALLARLAVHAEQRARRGP
jgi:glycosyltransferase involved in cell wall biosynthesis